MFLYSKTIIKFFGNIKRFEIFLLKVLFGLIVKNVGKKQF